MIDPTAVNALRAAVGHRLITEPALLLRYSRDTAGPDTALPGAVVQAESTAEVAATMRIAAHSRIPVVPFVSGVGLDGAAIQVRGGLLLDLTGMNRIVSVNAEDLGARVEAGVTRMQLNDALWHHGLFFPVDPGADASLGAMASTCAYGASAVRYGTMRENTLGLTVVTALGDVIQTGGRARKSSAGYDLTRLFIGAEGTLGVITELQLMLHGLPERTMAAVCQFDTIGDAVNSVIETLKFGVEAARIELLDEVQMAAAVDYSKVDGVARLPTLFYEFHGSPAGVAEQVLQIANIAAYHGGTAFRQAIDRNGREQLWHLQRCAWPANKALATRDMRVVTDVCVPISRLADCVVSAQHESRAAGVLAPVRCHVGDGSMQVTFLPRDPRELAITAQLRRGVIERAIEAGGTFSGEYGVAMGRREFLASEHGQPALALMRTIKQALDPRGVLNPGGLLPAWAGDAALAG